MRRRHIEVRGAATHNLRSVDVDIPLARVTAVTGVSGSGKSSLAIDTIYAEAQRRYVESLSTYARQYLARLERPSFERIDFIPPAIAIGQASRPRTARATVGTMSQVSDLLQLLWGSQAEPHCPNGHGRIDHHASSDLRARLVRDRLGQRVIVTAPVRFEHRAQLIRDGHTRVLGDDGRIIAIAQAQQADLRVLVDRLAIKDEARIVEAVSTAFRLSGGRADLDFPDTEERMVVLESLACPICGYTLPQREARLFSPSSAMGACRSCEGFGKVARLDREKVVPDPTRSLLRDAIAPWSTPARAKHKSKYHQLAAERGLRLDVAWQDLSPEERSLVWDGDRKLGFRGVAGFFERLEEKRYKMSARILIARYREYARCPDCRGSGLVEQALCYRIQDRSIADAHALTVRELIEMVGQIEVAEEVEPLRERLLRRARVLADVGLDYLTLDREGRSLSAGEARRVHLSSALGAGVTGTLYVLDEPSIGLHSRDTQRLARLLEQLADSGNTVLLVEHDIDLIERANEVLELGPGAGRHGGELIFAGTPQELETAATPTGAALRGETRSVPLFRAPEKSRSTIRIVGAKARTLDHLDLQIPRGALTCITGVSGSGKSTLLDHVLSRNLPRVLSGARLDTTTVDRIENMRGIESVYVIDTSPLARSARSIPATYVDAWTPIRAVLASSPEAKSKGLGPSDFSFNARGGRCDSCDGLGIISVDMQFLADVTMTCDVCDGRRFKPRVLEARWHGLNVFDVLLLTVDDAHEAFAAQPKIRARLEPLRSVGLGYLSLGQATSTLSAGEAQRLKLASHLASRGGGAEILLLDEPTTGLHPLDVERLLFAFDALLRVGTTLVIVEHNLQVICQAHHVIDLGPEGGAGGGQLVAQGTVDEILISEHSHTGRALAAHLARSEPRA